MSKLDDIIKDYTDWAYEKGLKTETNLHEVRHDAKGEIKNLMLELIGGDVRLNSSNLDLANIQAGQNRLKKALRQKVKEL